MATPEPVRITGILEIQSFCMRENDSDSGQWWLKILTDSNVVELATRLIARIAEWIDLPSFFRKPITDT